MNENQPHCLKCNSTQLHSDTKGFSAGKALVGGVLTGGIGLLAGFIGSRKIYLTCLNCGHQFMLQDYLDIQVKKQQKINADNEAEKKLELRIRNKLSEEAIKNEIALQLNKGANTESVISTYMDRMISDRCTAQSEVNRIVKENNLESILAKNNKSATTWGYVLLLVFIALIISVWIGFYKLSEESKTKANPIEKKEEINREEIVFDSVNNIIKEKTHNSICTILEDIRFEIHKNNDFVKKKYNSSWSTEAYDELEKLNKLIIKEKIKKYNLTLDDYVQMEQVSIDICKTNY